MTSRPHYFGFALLCTLCAAAASSHLSQSPPRQGKLSLNPTSVLESVAASGFLDSWGKQDGSLIPTGSRRLLQQGSCLWDKDSEECNISRAAVIALLQESESPLAEMIFDVLSCRAQPIGLLCNRQNFCHWNGVSCLLSDYAIGKNGSPCVEHAPATIAYYAALLQCPTAATTSACDGFENCTWDADLDSCRADFNQIYFGLDEIRDKSIAELLKLVERDGDRDFIMSLVSCLETVDEESCTGTCSWDGRDGGCTINLAAIVHAITVRGDGSHDPVCSYFSALEKSGCYTTQNAAECEANDACVYNNVCDVNFAFIFEQVEEDDSVFKQKVNNTRGSCLEITNAASCS